MTFSFHRIPVGICNCFLLRGERTVLIDGGAEGNVKAFTRDMAMNAWYLRLTPGLPVLADDIRMVVESWKKILPLGIKQVYPAHGMDFPVDVMHREIKDFESRV